MVCEVSLVNVMFVEGELLEVSIVASTLSCAVESVSDPGL